MIINVIPIYDKPLSINSPRQDSKPEELEELERKLKFVEKPKIIKLDKKPKKGKNYKILKLNRRIP